MCVEPLGICYTCWPQCAAACSSGVVLWLRYVLNKLMPVPLHMRDIAATCLDVTSSTGLMQ